MLSPASPSVPNRCGLGWVWKWGFWWRLYLRWAWMWWGRLWFEHMWRLSTWGECPTLTWCDHLLMPSIIFGSMLRLLKYSKRGYTETTRSHNPYPSFSVSSGVSPPQQEPRAAVSLLKHVASDDRYHMLWNLPPSVTAGLVVRYKRNHGISTGTGCVRGLGQHTLEFLIGERGPSAPRSQPTCSLRFLRHNPLLRAWI